MPNPSLFGTLHLQVRESSGSPWLTLNKHSYSSNMEYLNTITYLETLRARWRLSDLHRLSTFRIVEAKDEANVNSPSL
jgi:hypothetical protein